VNQINMNQSIIDPQDDAAAHGQDVPVALQLADVDTGRTFVHTFKPHLGAKCNATALACASNFLLKAFASRVNLRRCPRWIWRGA
jgi:hypothetical protein